MTTITVNTLVLDTEFLFSLCSTNDFIESLHKNDGVHFEKNWQDRAIKRYF